MFLAIPLPSIIQNQLDLLCCGLKHAEWLEAEQRFIPLFRWKERSEEVRHDLRELSFSPFMLSLKRVEVHPAKKKRGKIWVNVAECESLDELLAKLRQMFTAEGPNGEHHLLLGTYHGEGDDRLASYERDFSDFFTPPFQVEKLVLIEDGNIIETFPLEQKELSREMKRKLGINPEE